MKSNLPSDPQERKGLPIATGVVDYFPDALAEVARVSKVGNDQHNPGQPLHWDRSKSSDEADALIRHFIERGTFDKDGARHSAKLAWRALALLQKEIESEMRKDPDDKTPPEAPNLFEFKPSTILPCPARHDPTSWLEEQHYTLGCINTLIAQGWYARVLKGKDGSTIVDLSKVGHVENPPRASFVVWGALQRSLNSERGAIQSGPDDRSHKQLTLWNKNENNKPKDWPDGSSTC